MSKSGKDPEALATLPYSIQVIQEETTDGGTCFTASHPELPGCKAHGDTMTEAIANLAEARRLYIEGLLKRGLTVPPPANVTAATSTIATWEAPAISQEFRMTAPLNAGLFFYK